MKIGGGDAAERNLIRLHPQTVVEEVEIDIEVSERRPAGLEGKGRIVQRYPDLELAFVMLVRKRCGLPLYTGGTVGPLP